MKTFQIYFCLLISSCLFAQDPWVIEAKKIDQTNYAGVSVGNGMIGVVSSPNPLQTKEIVLAGAYDVHGRGRVSNFLKSFQLMNAFIEVNRHRISAANVSNMSQKLDMKHGTFTSSFDFEDKASIVTTYRSLRHLPFNVMLEIEIHAKEDFQLNTASIMQAPENLKEIKNLHTTITTPEGGLPLLTSVAKSPSGELTVAASNAFLFEEDQPQLIHESWDDNMHLMRFEKSLKKNQTYKFAIVGTLISSAHQKDPLNQAERLTIYAALQGKERLIDLHQKAWEELWATGDIQIEGDPQSQQDIRNMIYHLYSFTRKGTNYSLSPMGLSGLGYNGHVFWDTEVWMFPALLVLQPELAKNMINYRYDRLQAARENAYLHGYIGAKFPWESDHTGEEATPVWALSGPFEHHISACIGRAAWEYFCVTQDTVWLKEKGYPIIRETADFWLSRVEKEGEEFNIKNVVGADEWAENVDNDAWTNGVVKANLRAATKASLVLNKHINPQWNIVADGIPILKMKNGVTREHATYNGENIKQADANLLTYPLYEITEEASILKDVEYYQKRVPEKSTPAMTKSIFATSYARIGKTEKSYEVFLDAYRPNLWGPFRVIMETPGSYNPYFMTAAGGILQTVMMGYGGLRITDDGLVQDEIAIPSQWTSLKLIGMGKDNINYTNTKKVN
ncbi:glycoside hydrolase family 65 protein [Flammeovirga sp. MY04]|uniref:Putative trehalose n=1 Tax=Flammeovirga yaeyamensis TaxID=367791 RepID=D2CNR9_9BACT|nr:glycoside hydrolase family 65 protein [Flammeovirga sp. MY04]ACZ97441.1 putative trehalose [Flammeovirga yaeyamensis]ANQ52014.2 glycoside hydrolase family 65 protein [Flammeovirga sp. MY04]